jgi:hypothetical protein
MALPRVDFKLHICTLFGAHATFKLHICTSSLAQAARVISYHHYFGALWRSADENDYHSHLAFFRQKRIP